MFNRIMSYAGEEKKKTVLAMFCISIAVLLSVIPFLLACQMITPLVTGEGISAGKITGCVIGVFMCLALHGILYCAGLVFSHQAAFGILERIRMTLQRRMEKLALLSMVSIFIGVFAMMKMFTIGTKEMDNYYKAGQVMNNTIIEYINGMEVVKVFNKDGESFQRFKTDVANYRDFTLAWYRACWSWMAIYNALVPCTTLFALPFGSWFVMQGYSTLPDLILVLCLSFSVGVPILKMLGFLPQFPQLNYKLEKLEQVLDAEPLRQTKDTFYGNDNTVIFQNVGFAYEEQSVLRDVNLIMKENEITALVGESGSGKSTLAKLLVHYYDTQKGMITIGGQDITKMSYIFSACVIIVFLAGLDIRLSAVMLGITVIASILAEWMNKMSIKEGEKRQEQSEKLTEAVLSFAEGIGIIKSYNLLGEKSKELTDSFTESKRVSLGFEAKMTPWQMTLYVLYGIGTSVILGMGIYFQQTGSLELPKLLGLLMFVFSMFGPLKSLYSQATRLTVMSSCMDRIEKLFATEELSDEGTQKLPSVKKAREMGMAEVTFDKVAFAYEQKEVIKDISFSMEPNTMTALVGPSGGGKSTIASMLTRFWDVKEGAVRIRGVDIRNIPLSELMNEISMVFQRVYLFQDTIFNNISMGKPNATREEVYEAAKKARCYDFIMKLPNGFDTVVGEGGATLSGGEKQRISIARCILKDAPIVILDEATASVDMDNESYIQEAINELVKGKTLLVIAHRLNTIQSANQIIVVNDGKITQIGTHAELMKKGGIYRDFVDVRQRACAWMV